MHNTTHLILLMLIWLAYFVIHSMLASLGLKHWFAKRYQNGMRYYRLAYNAFASISILIPLGFMWSWQEAFLWQWQGAMFWLANLLAVIAIILFKRTLKYYDMAEFMGFRQIKENSNSVEDQENFQLSPLHHYVRHPWYFLGLILIWTRDMDPMFLLSAIMMTLYFIVGSRLEEKKLIVYHGDIYRRYIKKVPGIFPSPWRYLKHGEKL